MGAWGTGFFENDYAMDWIAELERAKDWSVVEQAFAAVIADESAERTGRDCSNALAAAAVLTAAIGRSTDGLPEDAARWVAQAPKPHHGLPAVAVEVIDAILAESELRDMWEEPALLRLRSALLR